MSKSDDLDDDIDDVPESTVRAVLQSGKGGKNKTYSLTDNDEATLVAIGAKDYLPVSDTLDIFHLLYGDTMALLTECVEYTRPSVQVVDSRPVTSEGIARFKATVFKIVGTELVPIRTAHKTWKSNQGENAAKFYYEDAESGAIGRVLRMFGISAKTLKSGKLAERLRQDFPSEFPSETEKVTSNE